MQGIYKVYVQTDAQGRVTEINSSAFVPSPGRAWVQIDEGTGDRYHHAQGNYLDKPIMDERGVWRYKLVDGAVMERTQADMDADYRPPVLTDSERIAEMQQMLDAITIAMADEIGSAQYGNSEV